MTKMDFSNMLKGLENSLKKNPEDLKNLYIAINAIGEFMKSNIGPNGSSKMFYNMEENTIKITKNGLVFIKELLDRTQNPIIKRLLKTALSFIEKYGDGSKSLIILSSELISKAEELINDNIPRNLILESLSTMQTMIPQILESIAIDNQTINEREYRIIFPVINSYYSESISQLLSNLTLQIYNEFKNRIVNSSSFDERTNKSDDFKYFSNQEYLDVERYFQFVNIMGNRIEDSRILNGIILDKSDEYVDGFPIEGLTSARILLTTEKLYIEERNANSANNFEFRYNLEDLKKSDGNFKESIRESPYVVAFKQTSLKYIDILRDNKINLLITEKGIDKYLQDKLLENRIYYIRRVKLDQMKQLASFLNIEINNNLISNDLKLCIGTIDRIRFEKLGKDKRFILENMTGTPFKNQNMISSSYSNASGTILIGGLTWDACEQTKLSIINAMKSLFIADKSQKLLYSNGFPEIKVYLDLKKIALGFPNSKQICLDHFSDAILENLRCLLRNQDIDSTLIVPELIKSQILKKNPMGIILNRKVIGTDPAEFYLQPLPFKKMLFYLAIEFVKQILRVDQIIPYQKMSGHENHHQDE